MNFNDGVSRADKLILFTFSHQGSHKVILDSQAARGLIRMSLAPKPKSSWICDAALTDPRLTLTRYSFSSAPSKYH